jgi:glutathione S-transferase
MIEAQPWLGTRAAPAATHVDRVKDMPVLAAYQARCEARPAFIRALASQLAHFERNAPMAA